MLRGHCRANRDTSQVHNNHRQHECCLLVAIYEHVIVTCDFIPFLLPSLLLACVWRTSALSEHVRAAFWVFVCVCACACGGTTLIIILVNTHMFTYWSCYQWAMKYLRLQRALWICLDFYWDHTVRSSIAELPPGQDYWHYWQLASYTSSIRYTIKLHIILFLQINTHANTNIGMYPFRDSSFCVMIIRMN